MGYQKSVLEVGCGTGQLALYFAIGTNNNIIGLDPTIESLLLAQNFAKKMKLPMQILLMLIFLMMF